MEKILVRHPAQRLYSILDAMYLLMKDFKRLNKQIKIAHSVTPRWFKMLFVVSIFLREEQIGCCGSSWGRCDRRYKLQLHSNNGLISYNLCCF